MKYLIQAVIIVLLSAAVSCSKTGFITSPDAAVSYSEDTLHYDTVFTTTGSVTQSFKIFNLNDRKLKLSSVKLMGGSSSAYKINVDGTPGVAFSDIEMEPNDSIYVFVTVTVNPSSASLPFIVRDSILVNYNGNDHFVQLESFGQNAHFLRGQRITADSTWLNDLPYVILDSVSVDENVSLTIGSGCRIYHHANAPFIVNGSLKVMGDSNARVLFSGDRLDPGYKDLPGSWPGLLFNSSSTGNVLNYAIIKNAYQGIAAEGQATVPYKIELNQCIVQNIYDAGILLANTSLKATNCLIANCGANVYIYAGGTYAFDFCTVVSYGNNLLNHQTPVLSITDADLANNAYKLVASFTNSIFYGDYGNVDNEVVVSQRGTTSGDFNLSFSHVLYKNQSNIIDAPTIMTSGIKNQSPEFENIDVTKGIFDFHLKDTSPAIDTGMNTGNNIDLDGKLRPLSSLDIGCYER